MLNFVTFFISSVLNYYFFSLQYKTQIVSKKIGFNKYCTGVKKIYIYICTTARNLVIMVLLANRLKIILLIIFNNIRWKT